MPLRLDDATSGQQRMQFDNNGNAEFGPATPSSALSFQGRSLLDPGDLTYLNQQIARPDSMPRITGAVNLDGGATVDIGCPTAAGFGSVNGEALIVGFNPSRTVFTIAASWTSGTRTVGYQIF